MDEPFTDLIIFYTQFRFTLITQKTFQSLNDSEELRLMFYDSVKKVLNVYMNMVLKRKKMFLNATKALAKKRIKESMDCNIYQWWLITVQEKLIRKFGIHLANFKLCKNSASKFMVALCFWWWRLSLWKLANTLICSRLVSLSNYSYYIYRWRWWRKGVYGPYDRFVSLA